MVGRKLVVVAFCLSALLSQALAKNSTSKNETAKTCTVKVKPCSDGLILPAWEPVEGLTGFDRVARAVVYFLVMLYFFLGVSIIADRFMAAIEVITSKKRTVLIPRPDGPPYPVEVRVWNETVSNLTLMALGSSAPEILLSVIEIVGDNFQAGDLGPGTIVGSAAFNLFVIIGLCVLVIPDGEVRRIKHLSVFFCTATWSLFAYIWMYLIIAVITPETVEWWEGLLTLLFFPAVVVNAFILDIKLLGRYMPKRFRKGHHVIVQTEGADQINMYNNKTETDLAAESEDPMYMEFERNRQAFIQTLKELRRKNPNMTMEELEQKAQVETLNKGPKTRAFYRIQATRKLVGSGNVVTKSKLTKITGAEDEAAPKDDIIKLSFDPAHYNVLENIGQFPVYVSRIGGNVDYVVKVDYHTEDGTAKAGSDYVETSGTLEFRSGDEKQSFDVQIIDDEVFEEDEHFVVRLSNLRVFNRNGHVVDNQNLTVAKLDTPYTATVMIMDDDHEGLFQFSEPEIKIPESVGTGRFKVSRSSGARGHIKLPYKVIPGTAGPGSEYEPPPDDAHIIFNDNQTEAFIEIGIYDDDQYEKDMSFAIELGEPERLDGDKVLTEEEKRIADMGKAKLGYPAKLEIKIKESMEFKNTVDKLLAKTALHAMVGTSSWREQFSDALTVSAGDDDDDGPDSEEKSPSVMDYVMHYLTVLWKLLFAFVPPTDYAGGWLCFTVSICMIGLLTAFIGDLASAFGCTVGLLDQVTAIAFVALGTSVPDTFASKVAAQQDEYADASVGNVTGSNAVNVFLGIGIAWTLAACYHNARGDEFPVSPGSLGFSVGLYCGLAFLAIVLLLVRRSKRVAGGELGGPRCIKLFSGYTLIIFWIIYLVVSSLESYCHIIVRNE